MGEAAVVASVIVVMIAGCVEMYATGPSLKTLPFFNTASWHDGIGFCLYEFQGHAAILDVRKATADPRGYNGVVYRVMLSVMVIHIFFGHLCAVSWGDRLTTPLVTDMLPTDPELHVGSHWVGWTVRVLFSASLACNFPLGSAPSI